MVSNEQARELLTMELEIGPELAKLITFFAVMAFFTLVFVGWLWAMRNLR